MAGLEAKEEQKEKYLKILKYFAYRHSHRWMDGRTDGRTDGQTDRHR
jgi:hypothetical protein